MTPSRVFWWNSEDTDAARTVFGLVDSVQVSQRAQTAAYIRYAGLYGDNDVFNLMQMQVAGRTSDLQFRRLTFNVTRSAIDTMVSKHASAQPRIEILTEGGTWEQQQRAKNTTRFIAGIFEEIKLYREAPLACRNAGIFGDGYVQFYVEDNKICIDRPFPGEIMVDTAEAINGKPRQMFRSRYISREVLMAAYGNTPERIAAIETASAQDLVLETGLNMSDMVKVVEAWHLPSSSSADDGRHIIAVSTGCLRCDAWDYDCFPFVRVRWNPGICGWYSQGLADQLMGIQSELNTKVKKIGLGIHLMATPHYLVEAGSKVVKTHLNNEVGNIITYLGTPPTATTNQVFTPEVYQWVENLYNKAYALAGISPFEATAKKPTGLDSAPSQREYADIASERHAFFSMEWQEFFKDCAWQVLRCAAELKGKGVDVVSNAPGKGILNVVKYSNCLYDDDDFVFKAQVGSLLPTSVSGKLSTVQDLSQSGMLTPQEGLKLLDFPDLQAAVGNLTAQNQYLDKIIYEMLVDGKPVEAEKAFLNPATAIPYVTNAYLDGVTQGAPEAHLDLLRQWLLALMPPPPPPPAPMPMGPPGAPMPGAPPQGAPPPGMMPPGAAPPPVM